MKGVRHLLTFILILVIGVNRVEGEARPMSLRLEREDAQSSLDSMEEALRVHMPVSPTQFLSSLVLDKAFTLSIFEKNKDLDVLIGEWSDGDQTAAAAALSLEHGHGHGHGHVSATRDVKYMHPIKARFPGMPTHAKTFKNQRFCYDADSGCLDLREVTRFEGIPYADYFSVHTEWTICPTPEDVSGDGGGGDEEGHRGSMKHKQRPRQPHHQQRRGTPNSSQMSVTVGVSWRKRTVLRGKIEKQTFAEQAENLQNWADAAIAWLFSVDMTFDTDDDSDGTSIPTPRSKEDRGDPLTGEDRYDDGGISDSGPNLTGVVTSGDGDGDSIGAWSGGMEGDDEGDDSVTAARRGKKKDDGHAVYIDTDAQSEREDGALACAAHARICEALSGADSDDDGRDWDVGGIIRPKSVVVGSGDADDGLEEMTDVWKFYTVAIANDDGASSMTSSDSIVDHSSISTCSDGDDGSWTAMAGATADTCESVAVAMANNDDDVMPSGSSRSSVDSSSRADTGSNSNSTAGRALSALVRTKEVGWARMLLGKRFRKPSWWRRKRRRSSRGHEFDAR